MINVVADIFNASHVKKLKTIQCTINDAIEQLDNRGIVDPRVNHLQYELNAFRSKIKESSIEGQTLLKEIDQQLDYLKNKGSAPSVSPLKL